VATLRSLSGGVSHLRKIVADMPDPGKENLPHFTTRTVANLNSMNVTEAAPWLIHTQAFDPAGTNTGSGRVADQSGNPAHRTQIARFLSVDEPLPLYSSSGNNCVGGQSRGRIHSGSMWAGFSSQSNVTLFHAWGFSNQASLPLNLAPPKSQTRPQMNCKFSILLQMIVGSHGSGPHREPWRADPVQRTLGAPAGSCSS
jgi:hypothetical protein